MRVSRVISIPAVCVCLLIVGCADGPGPTVGTAATTTVEEDRRAVVEAHRALQAAYERGDVEMFVAGLDPSPELLIYHPRLHSRFDSVERVRSEMGRMFARLGGAHWTVVHPMVVARGDAAWLTAQIIVEAPKLDPPFVGRATEIYVRREGRWLLTHAHWSADPEARS